MENSLSIKMLARIKAILGNTVSVGATENDILLFEKLYSVKLPEPFKIFLQTYNGGGVTDLYIGFSTNPDSLHNQAPLDYCVYYFLPLLERQDFGFSSVEECIHIMRETILVDLNLTYDYTRDFIPFALTAENLKISICCSEKHYGKIFLFEEGNSHPQNVDNLYIPIAESFGQFILDILAPWDEKSAEILNQRLLSQ